MQVTLILWQHYQPCHQGSVSLKTPETAKLFNHPDFSADVFLPLTLSPLFSVVLAPRSPSPSVSSSPPSLPAWLLSPHILLPPVSASPVRFVPAPPALKGRNVDMLSLSVRFLRMWVGGEMITMNPSLRPTQSRRIQIILLQLFIG